VENSGGFGKLKIIGLDQGFLKYTQLKTKKKRRIT